MTIDPDTFNEAGVFHGTKGLIQIGDAIIVLRRDASAPHSPLFLDLPGGGREDHESPFETLQREIMEMVHIPIDKEDIIYSKRCESGTNSKDDTFFMVTRKLPFDEKSIIFGEKGLMYYSMTIHDFLQHPDCVEKQKNRIIDYLNMVKEELQ